MYALYITLLVLCIALTLTLAAFVWRIYPRPQKFFYALFFFLGGVVVFTFLMMYLSPSSEAGYLWMMARHVATALHSIIALISLIYFISATRWLRLPGLLLYTVAPVLGVITILTNPLHHAFVSGWSIARAEGLLLDIPVYGPLYWALQAYYLAIALFSLALFFWNLRASGGVLRAQVAVLTLGIVANTCLIAAQFLFVRPPNINLVPVAYFVAASVMGWYMLVNRLFDIMPAAYSTVFKSLSDVVIVLDKTNRVADLNPTAQQWLGRPLPTLLRAPQDVLFTHAPALASYKDASAASGEIEIVREAGKSCYYDVNIIPLLNGRGGRLGRLITLRDSTKRKLAEQERERLVDSLAAYAHTVAHDLKTPLSLITGYLDLLEDLMQTDPAEARSMAAFLRKTAIGMGEIIDSLLMFAQVQHVAELKPERLRMVTLAQNAVAKLRHIVAMTNAMITIDPAMPDGVGLPIWIEQVWTNYISNAIKYGGTPPRVEVGATPMGSYNQYWVRDNGEGLAPEQVSRLFVRFSRLEQHMGLKGHGIGLALVQSVVEKLGGQVGVQSAAGQGSTFYFRLPCPQ